MKVAVITSLSGLNSTLRDPSNGGFEGVDYYAYVDRLQDVHVWRQRPIIELVKIQYTQQGVMPNYLKYLVL